MNELPLNSRFVIAEPELCYMDGNSLGRLPKASVERLLQVIHEGWGKDLIRGWNKDWINLPQRIGAKIAQLIGCDTDEVIVADSTSINLFKLATAGLRVAQGNQDQIISDATNFPSDLYILNSAAEAAGSHFKVDVVGESASITFPTQAILSAINDRTALVSHSHVAFRSAALADMRKITKSAHAVGALTLWDLSHSVGCLPINLHADQVDMAVGCTYKYLCGGPGAPAFLFVRRDLQAKLRNPIQGWFSHDQPFDFGTAYTPAQDVSRFLCGTPPILSLAAIEAGVDAVLEVGTDRLRERSIQLTSLLIRLFDEQLAKLGYELRSPREPHMRGSHVALGHAHARQITENLIRRHQVIPDFRTPDNIRLGIAPLYTTDREIHKTVAALRISVESGEYKTLAASREFKNCTAGRIDVT